MNIPHVFLHVAIGAVVHENQENVETPLQEVDFSHIVNLPEFGRAKSALVWPNAAVNAIMNFQIILRIRSVRAMFTSE